jgi:hypothetical protein
MKNEKKTYQSPRVSCVEVLVEQGFAITNAPKYVIYNEEDEE